MAFIPYGCSIAHCYQGTRIIFTALDIPCSPCHIDNRLIWIWYICGIIHWYKAYLKVIFDWFFGYFRRIQIISYVIFFRSMINLPVRWNEKSYPGNLKHLRILGFVRFLCCILAINIHKSWAVHVSNCNCRLVCHCFGFCVFCNLSRFSGTTWQKQCNHYQYRNNNFSHSPSSFK